MGQVVPDRLLQRRHAPEGSPADALLGDLREEPFHLVEPRPTGRREMEIVLGMTCEPALDRGGLMRPVIVQDQVDLDPRLPRDLSVDLIEELEELLLPMPPVALTDHLP